MLLLLLACSTEPAAPPVAPIEAEEASAAMATMLCRAAEPAKLACKAEGGVAQAGWKALEIAATPIDFNVLQPTQIGMGSTAQLVAGEVQAGFRVALSVDGAALLSFEVHEAGSDTDLEKARAAALEKAAQRWVASVGIAALDAASGAVEAPALAGVGLKVPAAALGDARVWAAFPALRGQGFDPKVVFKLGPNLASMAAALGPYVEDLPQGALHAVEVHAKLGGGGGPGDCGIVPPVTMTEGSTASIVPLHGEVLVDGVATGTICALSQQVAWPLPRGGNELDWEQVFVVGPASVVEGG